jgi:hypothetical protein
LNIAVGGMETSLESFNRGSDVGVTFNPKKERNRGDRVTSKHLKNVLMLGEIIP